MQLEKRNQKMATTIWVMVLSGILVTILIGLLMQAQTMPSRDRDMNGTTASFNVNVESAQSGPTGKLVISTGIVLLVIAFGVLVVMLWVGQKNVYRRSA